MRQRAVAWVACGMVFLAAACAGSAKTGTSIGTHADEIAKLFRQSSIDDVARGQAGSIDDVVRSNRSVFDDAFRASVFTSAVDEAVRAADSTRRSKVAESFAWLDGAAQKQVDSKLQSMICEARLYASNQDGDAEIVGPWLQRELGEIWLEASDGRLRPLTDWTTTLDLQPLTDWLVGQINDTTSNYSLACIAWARVAR